MKFVMSVIFSFRTYILIYTQLSVKISEKTVLEKKYFFFLLYIYFFFCIYFFFKVRSFNFTCNFLKNLTSDYLHLKKKGVINNAKKSVIITPDIPFPYSNFINWSHTGYVYASQFSKYLRTSYVLKNNQSLLSLHKLFWNSIPYRGFS